MQLMQFLLLFQTMTAPTPSLPTKWPGCTATWTWSIRAGSQQRNQLLLPLPPRSWLGPPPLSPWSGFHPSMGTSLKGDHALLGSLVLSWVGRGLVSSHDMSCTQPGLRLLPKLVRIEGIIDLFSALPSSACSTLLRAIDLPYKGQIFFRVPREEFSISSSDFVIPAYCCSQIPVGFSSAHTFPLLFQVSFARSWGILFFPPWQCRAHGQWWSPRGRGGSTQHRAWMGCRRTTWITDLTLSLAHLFACISSPLRALIHCRKQTLSVLQDWSSTYCRRPNLQAY